LTQENFTLQYLTPVNDPKAQEEKHPRYMTASLVVQQLMP
jgi:hypothetical protein